MKIFKPSDLIEQKFPLKDDIKNCYEQSQVLIEKMVKEKILFGATSYGSVPSNTHSVNSDIDWVFLFEDHNKILNSQDLKKIIQIHKLFKVSFYPPITTLESIKLTFNNLYVFQGMKSLENRFIAGVDPLYVYEENCCSLEYLNSVESYMQNFYKDQLEPVLYNIDYQNSFDEYVNCLEKSINAANQIKRLMILTLFNYEDIEQYTVSLERYHNLFRGIIPYDILNIGKQTQQFKQNYSEFIDHFVTKPINMLSISEYKDFLKYYEPLIEKSFEFCLRNLEIYKESFSTTLNI